MWGCNDFTPDTNVMDDIVFRENLLNHWIAPNIIKLLNQEISISKFQNIAHNCTWLPYKKVSYYKSWISPGLIYGPHEITRNCIKIEHFKTPELDRKNHTRINHY